LFKCGQLRPTPEFLETFLGVDVVQPYQIAICKAAQGFDLGEIEAAEVSNIIIDPCAWC
jgi:hypothetical protein